MKLITKNTDYAIRTLCFMARQKNRVFSASELSGELKIPMPFLRMILQVLSKKRILASRRGKAGGFKLALPAHRIFVADLIKIFQGSIKFNSCLIKKKICPDFKTCPLKKKIQKIQDYAIKEFKSATIRSFLEG